MKFYVLIAVDYIDGNAELKETTVKKKHQADGKDNKETRSKNNSIVKLKISKILFISRIVFPCCFGVFNIAYWVLYIDGKR